MTMHANTARALANVAQTEQLELIMEQGTVVLADYCTWIEAHEVEGRWVLARYSNRHAQWQSSDMPTAFKRANAGFSYAFADTLGGLIGYGVRSYATPVAAVRAALRAQQAEILCTCTALGGSLTGRPKTKTNSSTN